MTFNKLEYLTKVTPPLHHIEALKDYDKFEKP